MLVRPGKIGQTLSSGAKISGIHKIAGLTLDLTGIKDGESWQNFGEQGDPFAPIEK